MPCTAHADEWFTWDKANTQLHIPLTTLIIADYGQTMWARDNFWKNGKGREINNILGELPSKTEIRTYFALSYALSTFITYALPDKYSHGFQTGVIFMEIYIVNKNCSYSIGFKF